LKSLQPDARVLAIILEAETIFIGGYQVVSRLFDEVDHRLWLQSPLNQLSGERRASYIIAILCKIQEFCIYKPFSC
jgi:hypothetical protein